MKKIIIPILILAFFILPQGVLASAEEISTFEVFINLNSDSSFTVTEKIIYDFGTNKKHGIYRDIPYKYQRAGTNYNLRLKVLSVKDEDGDNYVYKASKASGYLRIRIGEEETYVTGQKTYLINYKVQRGINYFSDHDELYWNVTGNEWTIPILNSYAKVTLPSKVELMNLKLACYTGTLGSSETDCEKINLDDQTIAFQAYNKLEKGEGLTIVVGFPKGLVSLPSFSQKLGWFLADNGFIFLPLIVFLILFYIWWTRGRDPQGRKTIIPYYEPPDGLTPAKMGVLVDEKADLKDISASFINLAVKGFLKIKEIETKKLFGKDTDYEFIRLKDPSEIKTNHEKEIFEAIFNSSNSRKLSDLKNKFYKKLPKIKETLYKSMVNQDYFPRNPDKIRKSYLILSIFVTIFILIISAIFAQASTIVIFSTIVSGLILIFFSFIMPRKTKKGVLALEKTLGLKMYLEVAEKERIKFHNAPEKKPEIFEKLLPYAMILGVEKQWAEQFKDIYKTPPSWYEGHYVGTFTAAYLISSLNSMSHRTHSTFVSSPRGAGGGHSGFGGGGFSGGGFGGGGGGSW